MSIGDHPSNTVPITAPINIPISQPWSPFVYVRCECHDCTQARAREHPYWRPVMT